MKYAFIDENRAHYPVQLLCRTLGASKSGYYAWRSPRRRGEAIKRNELLRTIEKLFQGSRNTYGSPRIYAKLRAMGFKVSKKLIETIMRENGIVAKKRRKYKATTDSKHTQPVSPNILERKFDQGQVGKVWLSDITYLWTNEGWAYLAAIMDGHSRKIVGWDLGATLDRGLIIRALKMALGRENPAPGLIFHSDRGSQYASHEFRKILQDHKLIQSMSRRGNCWDNAAMESFFDTLKTEHVYQIQIRTRLEARRSLFLWIEEYYNRIRLHSSLGYTSPACFEQKRMAKAA